MRKRQPITETDIQKARDLVKKFGVVNVSYLPRADQEDIIRTRYGDSVRGQPISRMRDEQVYSVAKSVYDRSLMILSQVREGRLEQKTRALR